MSSSDERLLRLLREARRKLESERKRRSEPIAIVGIGCRFPGGASNPAAFWQLLASGVDATRDIPADRWDAEALYDPDPMAPGKSYVRRGGFLDAIDGFEPEFFGISPREAVGMDPQQRLLLEVAWEALEDGGIPPHSLRGSATGVWIGLSLDDYADRSVGSGDLNRIDRYSALGNARSVAAGRIAYVLDLHGPVLQVDASCASSLVAVHLASQSLRAGECDIALVGGVNIMSSPAPTVALCKLRALAPDGRCKTFDAAADGYGRGEGAGLIVLKRVSDAHAAGDRIYAVIRGTAVNHDGRSNGLTAPNGLAQEAVIRAALAIAGLDPSAIAYVEAHGTGTLLGDPIEVLALGRVYGGGRSSQNPLYLGSVKTNFGHLEGAAGIAGLIKTSLCLTHRQIVPHLHLREPNPKIPWHALPVAIPTAATEWSHHDGPRAAGVSSFGISGTNAHVVLEEAPALDPAPSSAAVRPWELVVVTARTAGALNAAAAGVRDHLRAHPEMTLNDVAYSLAAARSLLDERRAWVVATPRALCAALDASARDETTHAEIRGRAREPRDKSAWLFTGQGSQQLGMGRALYDEWPVFRDALDAAFVAIDARLDRRLRVVMWAQPGTGDAELLDQTAYTQPALFAFGWALARLWTSWGVAPDFVAGHSIGEITAACVAGVLTLEDAARLVCARGRLMQGLPSRGAMVAIGAPLGEVVDAIERCGVPVAVAAINAPRSVVISGDETGVMTVVEHLATRGIGAARLSVSHAFHSALMEPIVEPLRAVAESIVFRAPSLALVSNVSGQLAGPEVATAGYWVRHAREPVRFSEGMQTLGAHGCATFIELGPKPILLPFVAASLPPPAPLLLPSVRAGSSETRAMLEALGGWVVRGGAVDWKGVFPTSRRRVALPTYPWQRQRYWIERRPAPSRSEAIAESPAGTGTQPFVDGADERAQELRAIPAADRAEVLVRAVRTELARVLSMTDEKGVLLDKPLRDQGLDSLMAVELRIALEHRLGLPLETLAFDTALSTPAVLADRLFGLLSTADDPSRERVAFEIDAVLDATVRPPSDARPRAAPSHALLTGATGFLGAFLLSELLAQTDARVTCLVRAADADTAARRVADNLRHYGLWREASWPRVTVIAGDLAEPRLGLRSAEFHDLAEAVDAIYNNGAHLSYLAAYGDLKPSHVHATREMLRLASCGRPKMVHHISSVAVYEGAAYKGRTVTEAMRPADGRGILLPYSQCKWVSETLVWAAAAQGIPVTVHRPAFVSGSSVSGAWNTADFLCRVLKAVIEMGSVPGDLDLDLDFSPVDFVSRAIVHLSCQASSVGHAFHLQNPRGLPLATLADFVRSHGYEVSPVPYWRWVDQIEALAAGPLYPLLPFFRKRPGPEGSSHMELWQRAHRPHIMCERTTEALSPAGIECPALGRDLFDRYLEYLISIGFIARGPRGTRGGGPWPP